LNNNCPTSKAYHFPYPSQLLKPGLVRGSLLNQKGEKFILELGYVHNFFKIKTCHHLSQPEFLNVDLLHRLFQSDGKRPWPSKAACLLGNTVLACKNFPPKTKTKFPMWNYSTREIELGGDIDNYTSTNVS
jgi:hypothetical protein